MTSLSQNEKEKILDRIAQIKEDIWEAREYISSEWCIKCNEIYGKMHKLELELQQLISQIKE